MNFFFNGFMAVFGAVTAVLVLGFVWKFGAYVIAAILPKILSKERQAEIMQDLKKDSYRNAVVLRTTRRLGWHEEG